MLDGEYVHISLPDILQFATGARSVPPLGFNPTPSLQFVPDSLPVANTCANTISLRLMRSFRKI